MSVEIGTNLRVTLVNGTVCEGSLFSLDEQSGMMILTALQRPQTLGAANYSNPNVHVINGVYVKSVAMLPDAAYMALPPPATRRESLPPAEQGDFKKLMTKLKQEIKARTGLYHEHASIDACDTFEFFQRTNPDVKWSVDPEHLRKATEAAGGHEVKLVLQLGMGGSVLLSGNAEQDGHSWQHPKVIAVSPKDVMPEQIARLQAQAHKCQERATAAVAAVAAAAAKN
jgi:hypothetical protein